MFRQSAAQSAGGPKHLGPEVGAREDFLFCFVKRTLPRPVPIVNIPQ
jgi:hypothetical protein